MQYCLLRSSTILTRMVVSDLSITYLAVSAIKLVVVAFMGIEESSVVASETDVDVATHSDSESVLECTR